MSGWRDDIRIINTILSTESSDSWRQNLFDIATSFGHAPKSWRDAIRGWANDYGIPAHNWRSDLSGIAKALGSPHALTWRDALQYIAHHYAPPATLFFLGDPPRQVGAVYRVLADGVITANQIIFA